MALAGRISAAMRVGICAWSMWSTVTLTPTLPPQSLANRSNQVSWLGTKWLHSRIFSSPESLRVGSVKVSCGAPVAGAGGAAGPGVLLAGAGRERAGEGGAERDRAGRPQHVPAGAAGTEDPKLGCLLVHRVS